MLLSLQWLKEFVAINVPVDDLAHRLTMSGFEVECIHDIGPQWNSIIVADVLDSARHPDADKLTLNNVYTGEQTLRVVCGAPNVCAGQKVALALPGAVFPGGLVIKRSKIRGQISEGMLCSASELGIGEPDGGILELNVSHPAGTPLADALALRDTILDISVTPNRSDCLSVIGLAREVAALYDLLPVRLPDFTLPENGPPCAEAIDVDIQAPDACPRYCAGFAYDITITASPLWMRQRLENCGIRAINNVVDITNYVLLEWGQPLHAFDYSLLRGKKIVVRTAREAERFTTLDEATHTLPPGALMICDAEHPRALAGIMGGLDSSITSTTETVLLESAYFNPPSIAATGRALGLKTEASLRFEKGVDANGVIPALQRAASLIVELKAGKIASGLVDRYPGHVHERQPISVCLETVNKTLGLMLDEPTIVNYLTRLQMKVTSDAPGTLAVVPPTYRYDLISQIDIIEEIARLNGYDTIPVTFPVVRLASPPQDTIREVSRLVRTVMTAAGFSEVINYSFQDPQLLERLRLVRDDLRRDPVQLLNPLSTSQSVMRTMLIGSLLENLQHNLHANRCPECSVFEISNVFLKTATGAVCEKRMFAALAYGTYNSETWTLPGRCADIFDIKGSMEALFDRLHINSFRFEPGGDEPFLVPQTCMRILIDDTSCGLLGTIHPDIADAFDISAPAHVFELDFNKLCEYYSEHQAYTSFSRFPAVQRDLALVIDRSVSAADVSAAIAGFRHTLLRQWHIFDHYQGDSISSGKKSIAFRLTFQSDERTLTDSEVNKIHNRLLDRLRAQVGAELR